MDKTKRWSMKKLPAWESKLKYGNALERFIFDNEPAGVEESKQFRQGLINLLNETDRSLILEMRWQVEQNK